MRKIFLSVCLLVGTIAGLACEYTIIFNTVPWLFPVITGINASTNMIESVTAQELNFDTSGLTGNKYITYNPYITINHGQDIPEVSTPVTVYVQNIRRNSTYDSVTDYIQLNEITLYYRVKGDTQWTKAGVTKLRPSVHMTYSFAPFHGIPIFGHYTLDLNYPAGTIVHIAVGGSVTYEVKNHYSQNHQRYTAQIRPPKINDNLYSYISSKSLSEKGEDTEGDHVTIQISGKRRPRHE